MLARTGPVRLAAGEANLWPATQERRTAVTGLRFVTAAVLVTLVLGFALGPRERATATTAMTTFEPVATASLVPDGETCKSIGSIVHEAAALANELFIKDPEAAHMYAQMAGGAYARGHAMGCW